MFVLGVKDTGSDWPSLHTCSRGCSTAHPGVIQFLDWKTLSPGPGDVSSGTLESRNSSCGKSLTFCWLFIHGFHVGLRIASIEGLLYVAILNMVTCNLIEVGVVH